MIIQCPACERIINVEDYEGATAKCECEMQATISILWKDCLEEDA